MSKTKSINELITLNSVRYIAGYVEKINQPSVLIKLILKIPSNLDQYLKHFDDEMKFIVKNYKFTSKDNKALDILNRILYVHGYIVQLAKLPIYYSPTLNTNKDNSLNLFLPAIGTDFQVQKSIFSILSSVLNQNEDKEYKKQLDKQFSKLVNITKTFQPHTSQADISTVVVLGKYDKNLHTKLAKEYGQSNKNLATIINASKSYINNKSINDDKTYKDIYHITNKLITNNKIDALLMFIDDATIFSQGYPVTNANLVVVTSSQQPNFYDTTRSVLSYYNTDMIIDKASSIYKNFEWFIKKKEIKSYVKATITKKIKELLF